MKISVANGRVMGYGTVEAQFRGMRQDPEGGRFYLSINPNGDREFLLVYGASNIEGGEASTHVARALPFNAADAATLPAQLRELADWIEGHLE